MKSIEVSYPGVTVRLGQQPDPYPSLAKVPQGIWPLETLIVAVLETVEAAVLPTAKLAELVRALEQAQEAATHV